MMSLVTLFGGLKSLFKVRQYSADNVIFRLHYKVFVPNLFSSLNKYFVKYKLQYVSAHLSVKAMTNLLS